ncbi:CvpA family protein [uncultured Intestinimonas sp.]|uniref:CvpA family protein n=1 Tax=uncultured Intestinimonas sp. TaxID=1689265 RepID=UPI0025D06BB9|nr:CvpA family protein [uncultured Intestinimonas sp.]
MNGNSPRKPMGKAARTLISLVVTLVFGLIYFYLSLPALNLQDGNFYTFIFILCIVFVVASLFTSGFRMAPGSGVKEYFRFVKSQCLPVGILMVLLIAVGIIGTLISMPIFRAAAYRDLLTVEDGNFSQDIAQISFDKIPTLDRSSAEYLGDRQMGTLSDMVSQFEYSNDSTQINYQGRPVRVAPIDYADLIKWFTNRGEGLPAYVLVDMVTQEANVVRLQEGMKYSFSEPLNRNIVRHLRFCYPTYLFDTPQFEIDEEGTPYWIAPRIVRTIGLFGGTDIQGAVLCNAITGECQYYDIADVPAWVDNVYTPDLIMEQYDYHGTFINGFLNSILGQKGVTMTTEGYNYIALNDDVYVYTGVTSANADQSNLGFLLSNQRTKETRFYEAPGATEYAAMSSAEGEVQDLKYVATFPLLLNIAGEPTYFIPLKDATELVKSYAMVNVAQYQLVAVAGSVSQCEQVYIDLLSQRGIVSEEERPETQVSGVVDDIRSAVMDGSTYYFLRLEGSEVYYAVSASENPVAVLLNLGDKVTIGHAVQTGEEDASILSAYSLTIDGKAAPAEPLVTPNEVEPADDPTVPAEDDAVTVPIYG